MRYDEFRDRLQGALRGAGLLLQSVGPPTETLDLASAGRRWEEYTFGSPPWDPAPFQVSARIAFAWDAVNTARAYTCEEDILTELLGRRQRYPKTQSRWTRVDLKLYATLPCRVLEVLDVPWRNRAVRQRRHPFGARHHLA